MVWSDICRRCSAYGGHECVTAHHRMGVRTLRNLFDLTYRMGFSERRRRRYWLAEYLSSGDQSVGCVPLPHPNRAQVVFIGLSGSRALKAVGLTPTAGGVIAVANRRGRRVPVRLPHRGNRVQNQRACAGRLRPEFRFCRRLLREGTRARATS